MDMSHLGIDGVHLAIPPLKSLKPPLPIKKNWRSIRNVVIVHYLKYVPLYQHKVATGLVFLKLLMYVNPFITAN